ncbi:MAG: glycine--tRNA ligase subunit beta [Coxiella sp. (in: Bacteria)]|nr:MAG: glycine--tRNA ligase subunit beta [Coxiella sp. (in: g-proteobacteria)]
MDKQDFLLEIGCDELPARFLKRLSQDLGAGIRRELERTKLHFDALETYASPRRLAVLVSQLDSVQPERNIERHGPFVKDAYDKSGTPTLACIGFARSCGVSVDQLQHQESPKGERVCVFAKQPGLPTVDILAELCQKAIKKMPMPKPMRWGDHDISFLRPVQWVVMLFGKTPIRTEILGKKTTTETFGHRFHHPQAIFIPTPKDYKSVLYTKGYVVADFDKRHELTEKLIKQAATPNRVIIDPELLDEVTGLIEWPVALEGNFKPAFLDLPKEVLITSMKTHQKCFPVEDSDGKLQPAFVLVSNIDSKDPNVVIKGNERVIDARLSDAEFFYKNDCKHRLDANIKALDNVIFQKKLGSLGNKVNRITKLASYIAKALEADVDAAKHGAQLAKCDLISEMVFEFPSLQGIMGYYYAQHDKEPKKVATIIKEHYLPKYAGDALPTSKESAAVALADRLDTLVGIIGIKMKPTGDKDPFALRRAAQGIFRILIEKKLDLDLAKLIHQAARGYQDELTHKTVEDDVRQFVFERMKHWYADNDISVEVFEAVASTNTTNPLDFDKRVHAVVAFRKLPEAEALAAANKRVSNILKKQNQLDIPKKVNAKYFDAPAEEKLAALLEQQNDKVAGFYENQDYTKALTSLACLKEPIDKFFEDVMVMDKDEKKRNNRLALLASLRSLFAQTADISLISK